MPRSLSVPTPQHETLLVIRKEGGAHEAYAGFRSAFKSFATDAIHVGQEPEQWKSMAVVPPISLSTTFKQHGPGNHAVSGLKRLSYLRLGGEEEGCTCVKQTLFTFTTLAASCTRIKMGYRLKCTSWFVV